MANRRRRRRQSDQHSRRHQHECDGDSARTGTFKYDIIVTNDYGSATSSVAIVTVLPPVAVTVNAFPTHGDDAVARAGSGQLPFMTIC